MNDKDIELKGKLKNLTTEQQELVSEYCKNNMSKLKRITFSYFKEFNLPPSEHDEMYSLAQEVLMKSAVTYVDSKGAKFSTFLIGNIRKAIFTWYRDNYQRDKRRNLARDENGKKLLDEHKNPVIIPDISFDVSSFDDEGIELKEKIASDFDVERESEFNFDSEDKVDMFLNSLSKKQRTLLELKMDGFDSDQIKCKLDISDREYSKIMNSIKMNKNISLFTKNKNDGYNTEVENMEDRIIEISESENYRTDKYSMYSLIQDKKNGDMNCNYILQREPFQWTKEEANRYFCRLLSNLPIPEIILCEQKKKGLTISHLIDGLQRLSYAEAFKENRIKIGSAGAERHLIQYRDYTLDKNGNRVLDEDGLPEYEMKVCDVVGKYYKDLPDELKKRFNNFNVNVTKFFDCTDEQIADHIRDYNNHASMNKEQGGFLNVSAETANYIKRISQKNTFFKNCGKFTDANKIKGKLERVVAEAVMLLFFRDSWKANLDAIYKYVDENANEQQFLKLNSHLNRLELALGDNNEKLSEALFTPTTMPMWISVFDKFTTYNLDDSLFVEFLNTYNTELKNKEIDGVSMVDFKDQQTKKKTTITGKIDLLVKLMEEYLHIESKSDECTEDVFNETEIKDKNESVIDFVRNNVSQDITEDDIECFESTFDDLTYEVDEKSKLLEPANIKSMIALVAYSYQKDIDLEEWIVDFFNRNNTYIQNQKENYTYMVNDLNNYLNAKEQKGAA